MAHVTFIHGIDNKPAPEALLTLWRNSLGQGAGGISLNGDRVGCSMVYWADVLYASPAPDLEALATDAEGMLESAAPAKSEAPPSPSVEEAAFLAGLAAKLGGTLAATESVEAIGPGRSEGLSTDERVPLPWFIKRRFLERFLRDVHHYLFNTESKPRSGVRFKVQDEIRRRFVSQLKADCANGSPHIVVSHSMGTVIAYDCLKRVEDCPSVDGLITIGSPLGLDEIQDKLQPGWTRQDGFPTAKLRGAWTNIFDRLDPVDAFDPILANDYQANGSTRLQDIEVRNEGVWRHAIVQYLQRRELREALGGMLST